MKMNSRLAEGYKSRSQITRVISEDWGASNLYCPACDNNILNRSPTNTRVIDYLCENCRSCYQLKSSIRWSETRIPDAAYKTMIYAIKTDSAPNFFIMQYDTKWRVNNLLLIPSFFLTASAIEKRKPLSSTARRAGWIGCNMLLYNIAAEGKIMMVKEGCVYDSTLVRKKFDLVRPFARLSTNMRGWTLDFFRLVRCLGKSQFSLKEAYSFEQELSRLYPNNRNIRPKIRQQLQVLRDMGIIIFLGKGQYAFRREMTSVN